MIRELEKLSSRRTRRAASDGQLEFAHAYLALAVPLADQARQEAARDFELLDVNGMSEASKKNRYYVVLGRRQQAILREIDRRNKRRR